MKLKTICTIFSLVVGLHTGVKAQGLIDFTTLGGNPITFNSSPISGAGFTATLLGSSTGNPGSFAPVINTATSQPVTSTDFSVPGYFLSSALTTLQGFAAGASSFFQVTVTGNNLIGTSSTFNLTPGTGPFDSPDLAGTVVTSPPSQAMPGFALAVIPEPSLALFGLLGAVALIFRRRK